MDAPACRLPPGARRRRPDDAKQFTSGSKTDFMHQKEFSLDTMKNVVDALSKAVFSGAPAPAGTGVNEDAVADATKALGSEVGAMANLELYVAGKVFDVLSSIILSFGSSASISYTSDTKSESLGFGMQVFTSVAASSYESHSFFDNEYINQYLYLYDVRFSVKQAQTEATLGLVQLYQNDLVNFEKRENELADQLGAGTIDGATFESTVAIYDTLIAQYKAKIDALHAAKAV
ncbi:hypothetical protein GCM10027194_07730 [Thalassiella azotivora]